MQLTTGRLKDVVIKEVWYRDPHTGLSGVNINVFADADMKKTIQGVEGVVAACNLHNTKYFVCIDPRYDREWVKAEIEAAIRCAE